MGAPVEAPPLPEEDLAADLALFQAHLDAQIGEHDPAFTLEMAQSFLESSADLLARLATAASASDAGGMVAASHALKSSAASLGFADAFEAASKLETGLRAGTAVDVAARMAEIGTVFGRARRVAEAARTAPALVAAVA